MTQSDTRRHAAGTKPSGEVRGRGRRAVKRRTVIPTSETRPHASHPTEKATLNTFLLFLFHAAEFRSLSSETRRGSHQIPLQKPRTQAGAEHQGYQFWTFDVTLGHAQWGWGHVRRVGFGQKRNIILSRYSDSPLAKQLSGLLLKTVTAENTQPPVVYRAREPAQNLLVRNHYKSCQILLPEWFLYFYLKTKPT